MRSGARGRSRVDAPQYSSFSPTSPSGRYRLRSTHGTVPDPRPGIQPSDGPVSTLVGEFVTVNY